MTKSSLVLAALILSAWPTQARASSDGGPDVTGNPSPVDTSQVRVGASVTIVYGLGLRDPLSGEWPRLARAKGTIQAVDGERLLLALEGRASVQRIDLERIQGFDLPDAPSPGGIMEVVDTAAVRFTRPMVEREEPRWRAGGKLIAGMIGGLAGGFLGVRASEWLDAGDGLAGGLLGLVTGYSVGTACGVSITDPHDRFISALLGSVAGLALGGSILSASDNRWALILGPPVLSTLASEMWREESRGIRLSAGLSPGLRSASAVARIRF